MSSLDLLKRGRRWQGRPHAELLGPACLAHIQNPCIQTLLSQPVKSSSKFIKTIAPLT
jgi:hypothetical protein